MNNLPKYTALSPGGLAAEFYQMFKEEIRAITYNLFQKARTQGPRARRLPPCTRGLLSGKHPAVAFMAALVSGRRSCNSAIIEMVGNDRGRWDRLKNGAGTSGHLRAKSESWH